MRWPLVLLAAWSLLLASCELNPQPEVPGDDETEGVGGSAGAPPLGLGGSAGNGLSSNKQSVGDDQGDPGLDDNYGGFQGPPGFEDSDERDGGRRDEARPEDAGLPAVPR